MVFCGSVVTENENPDLAARNCKLVAPVWHMIVLLAFFAALTVLGWLAQRGVRPQTPSAPPFRLVPLQIQAIIFEWATLVWVWFGVRRKGVRVRELIGGRWTDAKSFLSDALLAPCAWLLWICITRIANLLFGHSADRIPFPATLLEGILAVVVSISAGVCEEIIFRGYLQRQLWALTRSTAIAILLQAMIFGVPHVYQGTRLAATVCLYGVLFGVLAHWRHSLRPGILAHAWSDIAARLLRM